MTWAKHDCAMSISNCEFFVKLLNLATLTECSLFLPFRLRMYMRMISDGTKRLLIYNSNYRNPEFDYGLPSL